MSHANRFHGFFPGGHRPTNLTSWFEEKNGGSNKEGEPMIASKETKRSNDRRSQSHDRAMARPTKTSTNIHASITMTGQTSSLQHDRKKTITSKNKLTINSTSYLSKPTRSSEILRIPHASSVPAAGAADTILLFVVWSWNSLVLVLEDHG
jgi:hypothetical protein